MSAAVRGEDAGRNGNRGTNQQRTKGELQCRGIAFEDNAAHGGLELKGLAQISAKKLLPIVAVLREQGLIEI
jgi:hypothetical protein